MTFALDTNTLIFFFKGIGQVSEHLLNTPPLNIAIPAVVLYELEVGIAKSSSSDRRREELDELTKVLNLLPFGRAEARAAAAVRADLEQLGKPIGPLDTLIAGTALANHATLVTHNTREFGGVPNLEIIDWV